ncbi:MAG: hypothetical protein FT714_19610, partial [Pantoea sp. Pent]|nr:hypothetical protein [Pantoea sp. Pent]
MLAKLTRLFPLWAVLLSVAAYYSPSTFLGICTVRGHGRQVFGDIVNTFSHPLPMVIDFFFRSITPTVVLYHH